MDHVKEKEISLAGYVFIKFGFNLEWQKSWILLENRTLYFTDRVRTVLLHFFSPKMEIFPFQNNFKNLDLSYMTDMDLWHCLGREK